jgi:hypothetical protein
LRIAGSKARQIIEERQKEPKVGEGDSKAEGIGDAVTEQLKKLSNAGLAPEKTTEEPGTIRLNDRTGKVEICAIGYISNEGPTKIWVDYDAELLAQTMGMCPRCHASFFLLNFKRRSWGKGKPKKMNDKFFKLIAENSRWDVDALLERLYLTWAELTILLKEHSNILEWSLHTYYDRCFLPNGGVYQTVANQEFTFRFVTHAGRQIGNQRKNER